jgi:hypothetical protein
MGPETARRAIISAELNRTTRYGWLYEDGIIDNLAVEMAVSGDRVPGLTYSEAVLVTRRLNEIASHKSDVAATRLIADRIGISMDTARSLMMQVRRQNKKVKDVR